MWRILRRLAACLLAAALLVWASAPAPPAPVHASAAARPGDRLIIDTRERTLTVHAGDTLLRTFRVGLASGGLGKERRGDRKNPLGTYRLMEGRPSKFHRFLPVSYPNPTDAERGLAAGLISTAQARAIREATGRGQLPPQDTALGGAIGIHGIGRTVGVALGPLQALHRYIDGSEGCFVLTDAEVRELETLYRPGALLEIR